MGVHGLWNLLEPIGRPVALETLENKVLAVDVSIWLHQATKGFRDKDGNPVANAHLLGLTHRLCKLLYYRIKPVFVFDGGVPFLKRQTMAVRQSRRVNAAQSNNKVAEKILENYIKSEIINRQLGNTKGKARRLPAANKKQEPDLFALRPLPSPLAQNESAASDEDNGESSEDYGDTESVASHLKGHNIHSVDVSSEAFRSLPTEMQHEILLELKDTRKQSSWNRLHEMPQEARDFSGFQVDRLLRRRNLQQRLNEVEKEISKKKHEEAFGVDSEEMGISKRIVSDSATRYVLIKKALDKTSPPKAPERKANLDPEVIPVEIDTNLDPVLVALEDEDGFSQQELFAMMATADKPHPSSSSSEEDSDLEEVPLPDSGSTKLTPDKIETKSNTVPSIMSSSDGDSSDLEEVSPGKPSKGIVLTIDQTDFNEEEDMFADVFSNTAKKPSEMITIPSSSSEELSDVDMLVEDVRPAPSSQYVAPNASTATFEKVSSSFVIVENEEVSAVVGEELEPKNEDLDKLVARKPSAVMDQKTTEGVIVVSQDEDDVKGTGEVNHLNESEVTVVETTAVQVTKVASESRVVIDEKKREELEVLHSVIDKEQSTLIQLHGRQERLATSITDQMYLEAQELLRLFGIPYLVAPMEAEAQCAFLDEAELTQGTITDDSDIWLFGGRRVYKNFFNNSKYVEFFKASDITKVFRLGREKLVSLALLTGSDYTEGVEGVGPVCALEILAEFPNEGLEALEEFRDWLSKVQAKKNAPPENKIRQKLRNLQVHPGFPNRVVLDAYINPEVNPSLDRFSWREPDLEALHDYLSEKIGWNRDKFKSVVLPVLERFHTKESQTRIDSYFSVKFPPKTAIQISKRVLNAIHKADFGGDIEAENNGDADGPVQVKEPIGRKRKQGTSAEVGVSKPKGAKKNSEQTVAIAGPSTSGDASQAEEVIMQRERDKQKLAENKLKAIEIFKRSRGRGKRLPARQVRAPKPDAHLSESSDST